jgi:hypothetical protein
MITVPNDHPMPDLLITGVNASSRELIWDLKRWLYKGGPSINISSVGLFLRWMEENDQSFELSSIQVSYINWTDHLVNRHLIQKDIKKMTIYTCAREVGGLIDVALHRVTPIIQSCRLKFPKRRRPAQGREAEKQNLEHTFAFGHLVQDVCDGITLDVLWGPSPVRIPLRSGGELSFRVGPHEYRDDGIERTPQQNASRIYQITRRIAIFNQDRTLKVRGRTATLRVLAEIMMFIGQTGMNLSQVLSLELTDFSYSPDIDGFKVREYKERRGGEVLFEIYKEYRSHFERYLDWRRSVFPNDCTLFPLMRRWEDVDESNHHFNHLRWACKESGVQWIPPSLLRNTRVNWLLRRSKDPDLTAEMAQHTKQTLIKIYEKPSLQRSVGEITRFWISADPTFVVAVPLASVAPGACDGEPKPVSFIPKGVAKPDCAYASGCMWCDHHRDIDSQDYVWSLACFRHLKILEASRYHPPLDELNVKTPGEWTIERASEKLAWFRDSNSSRRGWVEEALARVEEGFYHPDWVRVIEDIEIGVA